MSMYDQESDAAADADVEFEVGGDIPVSHEMFANAAITKLMLPPTEVSISQSIANSMIAIYGVLAEINSKIGQPQ